VLHLTHMETIGVRELQQHASAALRRVREGETLGVTDRGQLVAVLSPPTPNAGLQGLIDAGRSAWSLRGSIRTVGDLPALRPAAMSTAEALDEQRRDD
jgi:antitoxin (DNA-binding transcriptional repressor) of toxin-antitoxin stability system